jgi:DNA-binding LacI/PurR family transcriptional regulator
LSLIGSNDSPLLEFTDPPLTSIRLPTTQISTAVARALTDLINGRQVPLGEMLFQPELIVRQSTAPISPAG